MKKKIITSLLIIALSATTFVAGRFTAPEKVVTNTVGVIPDEYIDTASIVDWNTNGEELSVFTNDGYEWCAYKSQDIYTNKLFIPITE